MRIAGLIVVSMLLAACSQSVGGEAESPGTSVPPSPASKNPSGPGTTGGSAAPAADAPVGEVITWIEAGSPADPGEYHVAFRDGVTTRLGDDIAFTAPSGAPNDSIQCITDAIYNDGAPTCLVDLDSPAPRPEGTEGLWKPGWIEYSGTTLIVGALHGDPGPFIKGIGPGLPAGQTLAFGNYRCRSAETGLACVNYAHRTAVWISAGGVAPYGCLQPQAPPPDIAEMFSC